MRTKFIGVILPAFLVVVFSGVAWGQHGHGGMSMPASQQGKSHDMPMKNQPTQSVTVEGYKVTLEVMDMSSHMSMPGMKGNSMPDAEHSKSHALMVTVQDMASKEIITDAKVIYTILSPSGQKETGNLEWSGGQYGKGFSPKEKGAYQVQLMVESGGMEREAKFSFKL